MKPFHFYLASAAVFLSEQALTLSGYQDIQLAYSLWVFSAFWFVWAAILTLPLAKHRMKSPLTGVDLRQRTHHVVILGGGFGGLYAAQTLGGKNVRVTLADKRNFHLFQPLLYQVATGGLSPGDIASPLRAVLNHHRNITLLQAEAVDLDTGNKRLVLRDGTLDFDTLIVATGVSHHYFGHEEWASYAPGLKTVEDALDIRRRIFLAFEAAEREERPDVQRAWMNFLVVGGGPTGVELAGAIAELAHTTLRKDFRRINPADAQIVILEGGDRVLSGFPPSLSDKAERRLARMGVTVRTQTLVTGIDEAGVTLRHGGGEERLASKMIAWAAGVKASPISGVIARAAGAELDPAGRVVVGPDLTVPGHPELFVIGDLAHHEYQDGNPLPGLAPVAMQQGRYVAQVILDRLRGRAGRRFRYRHKGHLAVIGCNSAVGELGRLRLSGFPAWLIWAFVHISYLIEFDNKALVLFQWAWHYFTRKQGARLITGADPFPLVTSRDEAPKAAAGAPGDRADSKVG